MIMTDLQLPGDGVRRRTLVRGAAWTIPAISVGAAAPYAMASPGSESATGGDGATGAGAQGGAQNLTTVGLTASVVNIPCGKTVTFTVTGAGGGSPVFHQFTGGSGSRISGTFVLAACAAGCGSTIPVTLIAGGGGAYTGANINGVGATGGKGYGNGGNAGATNSAISAQAISRRVGGSGGAGSAILIGGVPVVIAGGGGGGGHVIDDTSVNSPTITWNTNSALVGGQGGNASGGNGVTTVNTCLLYTSPSPRD